MTPVQQAKAALVSLETALTVSGLAAVLSLATSLGYLGPREQIAAMRAELAQAKARVDVVEQAIMEIREDQKGLAIFACVQTSNQVVYAQLRCSARFGTPTPPSP
ncbi:MAG: hypothetical protein ACYC3L_01120 [Gemmatimonadaceae bacterium]